MRLLSIGFIASLAFASAPGEPPPLMIKGATITPSPGKSFQGSILLRHGLIEVVDDDRTPPDVEVIDGKGLHVYAGFIDAHTQLGLPDTKRTSEQRKAAESESPDFTRKALGGMQPANRKGLRPEQSAADLFTPVAADLKRWLAAGFAAVLVAPADEYFSGRSALVSLSGAPRRDALIRPTVAIHASFSTYGDGYPGTIMGSLAQMRQFLLDALSYHEQWAAYRKQPRGKARPPYDAALEAMIPVLAGELPVVFAANSENEILRALGLAEEFKFRIIISGGAEAYKATDRLKKNDVAVILSLALPKEPDKKKEKDEDRPDKLIKEEMRLWEEKVGCAAALEKAGIRFAFTTGSNPGESSANLNKLIEKGLSKEAALRALTVTAAEVTGASEQLGTVEVGKIANLTVLTAPLGDKAARVRYVICDGRKIEFDAKKGPPAEIDVTGTWKITLKGSQGPQEGTLELKQAGDDLTGTLKMRMGEAPVTGTVSGKKIDLTATLTMNNQSFSIQLNGELKEKELKGTLKTPMGDGEWSATKPEGRHD